MSDPSSPVLKGKLQSRRQAVKLAMLAGSTLAVGASPALADNSTLTPMSIPLISPGSRGLVKPNSAATPGTSYKLYSGLDFRPAN